LMAESQAFGMKRDAQGCGQTFSNR
jgi:hypothetical protein